MMDSFSDEEIEQIINAPGSDTIAWPPREYLSRLRESLRRLYEERNALALLLIQVERRLSS